MKKVKLTNFIEHSPWETDSHVAGQEIASLYWNTKVRYRVHKSVTIPCCANYIQFSAAKNTCLFKVYFNIIPHFFLEPGWRSRYSDLLRAERSEIRIPVGVITCLVSKTVHTGPGAHPASCSVGTGVLSREVKRPRLEVDHSSPSSAGVKNKCRYTCALMLHGVASDSFKFWHFFFDPQSVTEKTAIEGQHLSPYFGGHNFKYCFGYQLSSVKFYRVFSTLPGNCRDGTST
jgi:hypothetical protein